MCDIEKDLERLINIAKYIVTNEMKRKKLRRQLTELLEYIKEERL